MSNEDADDENEDSLIKGVDYPLDMDSYSPSAPSAAPENSPEETPLTDSPAPDK